MKNDKGRLLRLLRSRPIVIWGSRMTGIGFLRFARKHDLNAIGFVDSDPSLAKKKVYGLPVHSPSKIPVLRAKHKDLIVIVAVSIKEDEILRALKLWGVGKRDYIKYSDFCGYFFTIDVAGMCNLKCPSCAHSMTGVKNSKGFMSQNDFIKITKKMLRDVGLVSHVCLYSWGEPFLHPKLNFFIDHLHQIGVAASVSTNLSINSPEFIEKIVRAAPDYLKISLSGFYSDVYRSTHTGGNIDLVKSNLRLLRSFIDKHKVSVFVEVNYHLYKNNIKEDLVKMKELCESLGFVFSSCYANVTPVERLVDYCEGKVDAKTMKFFDLLLVGVAEGLRIARPYAYLPCRFLTNQVNVNWDRSVPLCCVYFDQKKSTVAKDYLKESIEDIARRRKNHPLCRKCRKYAIPSYLLGVNQEEWKKIADRNISKVGFVNDRS